MIQLLPPAADCAPTPGCRRLVAAAQDKVDGMIKHLASLAQERLIISFAPKTLAYSILKRIGELFPGPSKVGCGVRRGQGQGEGRTGHGGRGGRASCSQVMVGAVAVPVTGGRGLWRSGRRGAGSETRAGPDG